MKQVIQVIVSILILVTSSAISQTSNNISNSQVMKIVMINRPTNIFIRMLVPGSALHQSKSRTVEIKAVQISYRFTSKPNSGLASFISTPTFLEIHDPYTRKICFIDADHSFYVSDTSGMKGFTVGPGALIWSYSYFELPDSVGDSSAISQFEKSFDDQKFNQEWDNRKRNRIELRQVVPQFYFSDGPYPGGGTPLPKLETIEQTDGILRLDIRNPVTKIPADFWIDLKSKKVTKSVVDGQEMDLNTGKPFAVPLKAK